MRDCPIFPVIEKRLTISGIAGTINTSPITGLAIVRAIKPTEAGGFSVICMLKVSFGLIFIFHPIDFYCF